MPRTSDPELHTLWRDRVRRQADSGLTIVQFCNRERVSAHSFHAWKRRFRLIDHAAHRPVSCAPPAFLPVTVRVLERALDEPLPIEADLPNGVRLRIPTTNPHLACRFVRAIAAARTDSGGSR